ncbi:MAG: DNA-binding domain-containing protein [Woeseiaceae bacterium]|nr:DNA-binding domain-containing protein [Woeseiaceae bacterium]
MPELDQIERWLQALFTDSDGIMAGLQHGDACKILPYTKENIENLVQPSKQLSSLERLSIYRNMYFSRLIEVMAEEFPTVQHLLGKERFGTIVTDYVSRYPSTHYSLTRLGCGFPAYLADDAIDLPEREFAAAIAMVERAMEDVFDAPLVEPIHVEVLEAIPIKRWGDIHLQTIPALRLMQLQYPVNPYITAVREKHETKVPRPAPAYIAVYRHNYRVWRVDLDAQRFALLSALQRGERLGAALELCAAIPGVDAVELTGEIGAWFQEWAKTGLFCEAKLDT